MAPDAEPGNGGLGSSILTDDWSGTWGAIEPIPHSVETLCLQIEEEAGDLHFHYYPYRTMSRWNWSTGEPETLEILAAGILLRICGKGLRRLAEALNSGQLRLVRVGPPDQVDASTKIQSILLADGSVQSNSLEIP